jgi:UDP-glucose 4-epimerase
VNADSVTWVVGAGGLLGRHVVGKLEASSGRVVTGQVPWGNLVGASAALADGLDVLCNDAPDGRWNIVWCAGAGVVATPPDTMEAELAVFETFLAHLGCRAAAARDGCFFLASSAGGVYAGSQGPPFTEGTEPHPLASYGAVKLAMEHALATLSRSTGMRALIGRISNLYGPGQKIDKAQGLVSQLCQSQVTGQPVSIYVPFDTLRDYLFVADCADIVVAGLVRLRRRRADDDPLVVKVIASGHSISVGGMIGESRRVLRSRPRVLVRSSSTASAQARDLRLRSVVWPELERFARTPLPVGIAATAADVQRRLRASMRDA